MPGVSITGWPGDAGAGEVWAGTLRPAGTPCVVRLVRLPGDAALRRRAVAATRPLIELRHPHLVPVLTVSEIEEGLAVVTAQVPDAVSLRRLLDVRGRLDPGEVVTIGLPVAQALTAAHAAGLVHGSLGPDDILLEQNGRPQLAGIGVGALGLPPPGPPEPGLVAPVDVYDLADLLLDLMAQATGPDAAAVAVAVATALVPDLARRPTAAELAANLAHSARPAPVQMINPPPPPAAARGGDTLDTAELHGLRRAMGPSSAGLDAVAPPDFDSDLDSDLDFDGDPGGPADENVLEGDVVDREAAVLPALPPQDGLLPLGDRPDPRRRPGRGSAPGEDGPPSGEQLGPRPARPAGRGSGAHPPRQGSRGAQRGPGGWLLALTGGVGLAAVVVAVVLLHESGSSGKHDVGAAVSAAAGPAGGRTSTARPTSGSPTVSSLVSASPATGGPATGSPAPGAPTAGIPTPGRPTAARTTAASPAPEQVWRTVLAGLNTTRSRAFEHDDEAALAGVYQVGSTLYVQDLQTLREVAGRGAHTSVLTTHILDLQIRQQGTDQAVLRVTDQLDAYDFLDANGKVLAHKDGEGPKRGDVTLVRTAGGWRISERVPVA